MSSIPTPPPQPNPTSSSSSSSPSSPSSTTNTHPHPQPQETPPSKETHEAKTAFTATLRSVGQNHETQIRDRARTLHANATALSKQESDLQRATEALAAQNDSWAKVADQARDGLKEIGDVQNWAEVIERELLVVEETVRLAEERERERERARERGLCEEEGGDGDGRGGREEGEGNGVVVGNGIAEDGGDGGDGKDKGKSGGKSAGKGWFWW